VGLLCGDGVERDGSVEEGLGSVTMTAVRFERDGEEGERRGGGDGASGLAQFGFVKKRQPAWIYITRRMHVCPSISS